MRDLLLTDGRTVQVSVEGGIVARKGQSALRRMQVWLTYQERVVASGEAVCHPKDRFVKLVGRRVAANKLLAALRPPKTTKTAAQCRHGFSVNKADRRAVFLAVCPEYAPALKTGRRALKELAKKEAVCGEVA